MPSGPAGPARATFLLPARERFGGQRLGEGTARAFGRGDVRSDAPGTRAQLRRHFTLVPDHWPVAALARRVDAMGAFDAGDAQAACWLRADPAHVRAGINGATLLACGDMLALSPDETDALLRPLRPIFGDAGFTIDAPVPGHWYLRLPREARLPAFAEPGDALGSDVFDHLPVDEAGRRWRHLLSEAEVVLHNHPHNAVRVSQGQMPVNSLWFWGGGVLPDHVSTVHTSVHSDDETLRALAHGIAPVTALPYRYVSPTSDALIDLRHMRDLSVPDRDWLQPALQDVARGALATLELDFADGHGVRIARGQRLRFWRKPRATLLP